MAARINVKKENLLCNNFDIFHEMQFARDVLLCPQLLILVEINEAGKQYNKILNP